MDVNISYLIPNCYNRCPSKLFFFSLMQLLKARSATPSVQSMGVGALVPCSAFLVVITLVTERVLRSVTCLKGTYGAMLVKCLMRS